MSPLMRIASFCPVLICGMTADQSAFPSSAAAAHGCVAVLSLWSPSHGTHRPWPISFIHSTTPTGPDVDPTQLCSSLCHPHIATIQAIFRMRACVCLRLQHCNGGCVFPMVVRGGPGGIAQAAAVFLIQQATLAADFLHRFDKYLHALSPQSLRVHWNATGVPILKIISVPLPAPVRACPRWL